jgi:hypothetical protein
MKSINGLKATAVLNHFKMRNKIAFDVWFRKRAAP